MLDQKVLVQLGGFLSYCLLQLTMPQILAFFLEISHVFDPPWPPYVFCLTDEWNHGRNTLLILDEILAKEICHVCLFGPDPSGKESPKDG